MYTKQFDKDLKDRNPTVHMHLIKITCVGQLVDKC